jgi:hypothetical protein
MVCIRRGFLCSLFIASGLLLMFGSGASAQQVFGSIIGTVTDPSGSAVNNAKVTITDVTKGTSFEVNTNESGQYTKGQLIPDTYKVTIEAPGFQKTESNDLAVQVDQSTQFNAALTVGNVEQTVEVTAAAPLLQTDRADVAQTFTSQEIQQLPSIGRNLQAFELLNPGTIKTPWAHASDEDPQGSVQGAVNGLPFFMTGYYLDGTVNQDPILGIIVINPTFDSVNEIKQANQDYDAEFDSFAAGLFTYSTKSGTNSFHGDAFEYLEVNTPGFSDFARNPFTEIAAGLPNAPTTHQNQYGGSIGGRIIKDKLFFFGDAQLTRKHLGGSVLTTVPTAQERTGNLSDWLAVEPSPGAYQAYDPTTGNQTTGLGRTPFAGDIIPASRLSPQALALLNYFPLPNTGSGLPYNNYAATGVLTVNGNQWNTRFDYYGNEKNTFFGRYSYAGFTEQAPGAFGELAGGPDLNNANYAGSSQALNQSASAGWTYTKSPTTINEFRWGYVRYHVTDVPNGFGSTPAATAGIPGTNTGSITSGMPAFDIADPLGTQVGGNAQTVTALGYSLTNNQCNCPLTEFERQYQFVDNVSHIAGKHSFKFGGDIRYAENLRVPSDSHRAGEFTFQPAQTALVNADGSTSDGLALASFLLGDVNNFNRYVSSSLDAEERQKRLFWYGQDEWRPTSKLTITYGVRWEMIFPETVNAPGNGAELNLTAGVGVLDVFGEGLNSSHGYQNTNWHDFAPRVGIAYQLGTKTVIRAGYGWTYSLGTFGSTFGHNVTQNPPVLFNQSLTPQSVAGNNFADVFTLAQGPPPPPAFSVSPEGTLPCPAGVACKTRPGVFTMPVAYAYNFTVQQQLSPKVSVTGGYVGNSGRHGPLSTNNSYDENPIYFLPGFTGNQNTLRPFDGLLGPSYNFGLAGEEDCYCNDANSQYNSFQGIITVKALAGYTLQGNYTYQVATGDGWGPDDQYTFQYDRPLGYGNSSLVPHQQWVLANVYDVPFGRGRHFGANVNRAVDLVLGGWQVSGIFTYYSGIPFMPNIGSYPAGTGQPYAGPNSVPDVGSGSPYTSTQNRNTWIVTESAAQLIAGSGPFKLPAANTFGNYPINTLIGPLFVNLDASLMKVFNFSERFHFQLRMDATNALNHANLSTPSNNVTGGTAEQITNIAFNGNGYSMRRVQFSGTLNF